jgi:hypothetical protein
MNEPNIAKINNCDCVEISEKILVNGVKLRKLIKNLSNQDKHRLIQCKKTLPIVLDALIEISPFKILKNIFYNRNLPEKLHHKVIKQIYVSNGKSITVEKKLKVFDEYLKLKKISENDRLLINEYVKQLKMVSKAKEINTKPSIKEKSLKNEKIVLKKGIPHAIQYGINYLKTNGHLRQPEQRDFCELISVLEFSTIQSIFSGYAQSFSSYALREIVFYTWKGNQGKNDNNSLVLNNLISEIKKRLTDEEINKLEILRIADSNPFLLIAKLYIVLIISPSRSLEIFDDLCRFVNTLEEKIAQIPVTLQFTEFSISTHGFAKIGFKYSPHLYIDSNGIKLIETKSGEVQLKRQSKFFHESSGFIHSGIEIDCRYEELEYELEITASDIKGNLIIFPYKKFIVPKKVISSSVENRPRLGVPIGGGGERRTDIFFPKSY